MKINEIPSDDESVVYEQIRTALFILSVASTIELPTPELLQLINSQKELIFADRANLIHFVLKSERIATLYNELKQYM